MKRENTMCGRFVRYRNIEELKQFFSIDRAECETTANFNVAPSQEILAIVRQVNKNVLDTYHWGLEPSWAKDISIGNKMINARSETVATKPSFRGPCKHRRCLIPADGFYEWVQVRGQKQPVFITLPDERPFAFAGLWDVWHDKRNPDIAYRSCTIITRDSRGSLLKVHNRMPSVLLPDAYDAWLDPENHDVAQLQNLLSTRTLSDFIFRPVSKQVNSTRTNEPGNIRAVQAELDF
jgi:putative SOS response-associated peptidase YedK